MRINLETPTRTNYMSRGLIRGFDDFNHIRIARTIGVSKEDLDTSYPYAGGVRYNLIWVMKEKKKGSKRILLQLGNMGLMGWMEGYIKILMSFI